MIYSNHAENTAGSTSYSKEVRFMQFVFDHLGEFGIALGVIILICIVVSGYCKAPPDEAYIISGLRKKVLIGKAGIKIPFLERLDKLSLKLISVDVKTATSVPTLTDILIKKGNSGGRHAYRENTM